jgi:hypothetical protein
MLTVRYTMLPLETGTKAMFAVGGNPEGKVRLGSYYKGLE